MDFGIYEIFFLSAFFCITNSGGDDFASQIFAHHDSMIFVVFFNSQHSDCCLVEKFIFLFKFLAIKKKVPSFRCQFKIPQTNYCIYCIVINHSNNDDDYHHHYNKYSFRYHVVWIRIQRNKN